MMSVTLLGLNEKGVHMINRDILPMRWTTALVTHGRRIYIDPTLADELPAEGIPRKISRRETKFSVSATGYGLLFDVEQGRMTTPEGQEDFALSLAQVAQSMILGASHEAMTALVNPDPEEKAYKAAYGVGSLETFKAQLGREVTEFMAGQKDTRGTIRMHDHYARRMLRKAGVEPNYFIVERTLQRYIQIENPQMTDNYLAGPAGPRRLNDANSELSFRHTQIINPPIYEPDCEENGGYALTDMIRTIGEVATLNAKGYLHIRPADYVTDFLNAKLWDMDLDKPVEVRMDDVIACTRRFDEFNNLNENHQNVANDPSKDDMFFYKVGDQNAVCRVFGQMREEYLPFKVIRYMAATTLNALTENEVIALNVDSATDPTDPVWRKFHRILYARFGKEQNPFLAGESAGPANMMTFLKTGAKTGTGGASNMQDVREVIDEAGFDNAAYTYIGTLYERLAVAFPERAAGWTQEVFLALSEAPTVEEKSTVLFRKSSKAMGLIRDKLNSEVPEDQWVEPTEIALGTLPAKQTPAAAAPGVTALADIMRKIGQNYFYHKKGESNKRQYFDADAASTDPEPEYHIDSDYFPFNSHPFKQKFAKASGEASNVMGMVMKVILATPIRLDVLEAMLTHDVYFPFVVHLARMNMRFVTHSPILVAGGEALGNTNYGHVDVTLGSDVMTNVSHVRASWWVHCVVRDPNRVAHMSNHLVCKMLGGGGTRVMTDDEFATFRDNQFKATPQTADLIAILVPHGHGKISGDWDIRGGYYEDYTVNDPPHYVTKDYEMYNSGFGDLNNAFKDNFLW